MYLPKLSAQAQKFGILMKKASLGIRSHVCKHRKKASCFLKRRLFYLLVRLVEKSTLEQLPVHQDQDKETLLHRFLADTLTLFQEACSRGIVSTLIPMYRGTTINFSQPNPIVEGVSSTSIATKSRKKTVLWSLPTLVSLYESIKF